MKVVFLATVLLLSMPASAQVFTCIDDKGGKVFQQTPCSSSSGNDQSGYLRCIKQNGDMYVHKGQSCPIRFVPVPRRAGMVTDVRTGQQQFMVPGGGNGMIDPMTGQRHELISPREMQKVQDDGEAISRVDACAQARIDRDQALTDFDRTVTTIRAAEARYASICNS